MSRLKRAHTHTYTQTHSHTYISYMQCFSIGVMVLAKAQSFNLLISNDLAVHVFFQLFLSELKNMRMS